MLKKLKEKVEKKTDLINKLIISKLKIYVDDSVSEVDELNKIYAKIDATADEALNVICNMMCEKKKKRKRLKKINIDKKVELLDRVYDSLEHVISEIKNETDEIYIKMCNVNGLDKDALHLINDKLNEIMTQSKKNLIKVKDILSQ